MSDAPTLLYLETDDEVTSVARRVRQTDAERIVLVAPGRSRATSSVVVLRLLAKVAEDSGRGLAVVGDALTRSLATEAGLDTYASVDDARGSIAAPPEVEAKGASIHVVRGDAAAETAAVPLAVASIPSRAIVETETVAVPVDRRPRRPPAPASPRRAFPLALLLGGIAVLLVAAGAIGAVVLPSATVAIVPRSQPIGPVSYEIRIEDPDRLQGSVEASATVTATGTYPIQVAAIGAVVLFNFNIGDVPVPAGTLVAAGDQAFETVVDIVVPAGSLNAEGRIEAGEESVEVAAAAIGPAANIASQAIDTILNEGVAAQLRGFPNNGARLVLNPDATTGGIDTTGPEITQADADAATAALREALDAMLVDALGDSDDVTFADAVEAPEPEIQGLEGLVERRDAETAEISGTLDYDRLIVERTAVVEQAVERLIADGSVLPPDNQLLPAATDAAVGEAHRDGDALVVAVEMTGASAPVIDRAEVIRRVQDRSADDAREALTEIGDATITLWPGWVTSVPSLDWRIEVTVAGERPVSPVPSSSGSAAP